MELSLKKLFIIKRASEMKNSVFHFRASADKYPVVSPRGGETLAARSDTLRSWRREGFILRATPHSMRGSREVSQNLWRACRIHLASRQARKINFGYSATVLLFVFSFCLLFVLVVNNASAASYQASDPKTNFGPVLRLPPGGALTYEISFLNSGTQIWTRAGHKGAHLHFTEKISRKFYHPYWPIKYVPAYLLDAQVEPGERGTFRFALRAPQEKGQYNLVIQAWQDLEEITGARYAFVVLVGDQPIITAPSSVSAPTPAPALLTAVTEPVIRVKITENENETRLRASGPYTIQDQAGRIFVTQTKGEESTVRGSVGSRFLRLEIDNKQILATDEPLRFVPTDGVIMEIVNFERRPTWNPTLNDNQFRGLIEIAPKPASNGWWVINELSLEPYLRGLGEVNESQPYEHIKSLITAARTYAQYHITNDKKHPNEPFHLDATANDQIYLGYGFELRAPTVQRAVEETRGLMILYQNEPIIAAYSSCTDGRTRAWREVWGKDQPWAQSVLDQQGFCADAATIPGNHMVGLSSRGSQGLANQGKTYQEILKYYYTGVKIVKRY